MLAVGSEYAQSILSPIRAHADLVALVVAHGHVVSTSFEGAGVLACNDLPSTPCRGGTQAHFRVLRACGDLPR